ncbi:MAG: HAD-IC family P-type ATPase, partial [Eubacterium sp.]|nr:HAD-IC family P-type ATPase [Eubacterium sp.]
MKSLKSTGQIIRSHTLTYFNFLNAVLATLVILSGQYKNMLFIGVVISNALIGIIQELKVKKIVDRLTIMTATKAKRVTKSGMEQIDIDQIAVGDILSFSAGDQIVADCEVILPEGLEVNESMLTGESLSVFKKSGAPLYSGTYVVAGSTTARVVHTKDENYAAKLVQKARTKRRATSEMQNTIKQIIRHVSMAILPIGAVLFYIQYVLSGASRSDSLVTTVAGVLGMIPEGLVLLTSVSFILGVGRLAQKGALVQEMESIEALARSTVLCLDKTGTITTGNLVVEDICPLNSYADETVENLMNAIAFAFHDTNATSLALQKHFSDTKPYAILDRLPFHS